MKIPFLSTLKKLTEKELRQEKLELSTNYIAPELNFEVRKAVDDLMPRDPSPKELAFRIQAAKGGDIKAAIDVISYAFESDLHASSELDAIVDKAMSLNINVEPGANSAQDKETADATRALFSSPNIREQFRFQIAWLLKAGFAGDYISWDTSDTDLWHPNLSPVSSRNFTFEKSDVRTPKLLPLKSGDSPEELPYTKFWFTMNPGTGLPYLTADGLVIAQAVALKKQITKAMISMTIISGQPMRIGKLGPEKDRNKYEENKRKMRIALESLGNDAWAMLGDGLEIDLKDPVSSNQSSLYLDPIRYLDEKITKKLTNAVLATGTGNTGSGGSQALGSVHESSFESKAKAKFDFVLNSFIEQVLRPYIEFNFGPGRALPIITTSYATDLPVETLVNAVDKLVALGAKISEEEMVARLGLRAPAEGEAILTKASLSTANTALSVSPPAQNFAENNPPSGPRALGPTVSPFASVGADEIDAILAEFEKVESSEPDTELLDIISSSTTFSDLKANLEKWVKSGDVNSENASAMLTAVIAAGELGADVGGE